MKSRANHHFFVLCLCFFHVKVLGVKLSPEEDLELENQLKMINKPATKTVQTIYGDSYDCVDFYKQRAFDHPALKNHSLHFRMKPSTSVESSGLNTSSFDHPFNIWVNGESCPLGTVPTKRVTKDDLIRDKLMSKIFASENDSRTDNGGKTYSAYVYAENRFAGAGMEVTLWNPYVRATQYSAAYMRLENGPDIIEVGWMVNPMLYKDKRTRFYIYHKAGKSQCFGSLCPGFIHVRTDIPLDYVFSPTTVRNGKRVMYTKFVVYRDPLNKAWWLKFGPKGTEIGFWPQKFFTGLADVSTYIEWGGKVFTPPNLPLPEMGAGKFLKDLDTVINACCSELVTFDADGDKLRMAKDLIDFTDNDAYTVENIYGKPNKGHEGYIAFFGGPGKA